MRNISISTKKQKLIDNVNESLLKVGEVLYVKTDKDKNSFTATIDIIDGDIITIFKGYARDRRTHTETYKITKKDITSRDLYNVGANPFDDSKDHIRTVAFSLDSIIFQLDLFGTKREGKDKWDINGIEIKEANWNPFIYNKNGEKEYYQRPFVWVLKDNQLLIESIYQNIDCGKILVRKRDFSELRPMVAKGETDLAFQDIVDGKQRLNAIKCFMLDEFPDLQGNYFSDLSSHAQHQFTNHQLFSYAEMPSDTKDELVIKQFLKLNFTGVPQSQEHIDFVKSLQSKI